MHHLVENTGWTARGVTKALLCKAKRIGNSSFIMIFIDLIDLELFSVHLWKNPPSQKIVHLAFNFFVK